MKKIYTVAKYAKSIMLAAVMTASALTTVNAQEADNGSPDKPGGIKHIAL